MKSKIRFALDSDVLEIDKLGTEHYSSCYYESEQSFVSKIKNCSEGCLVADVDGVVGYLISFPYKLGKIFPIDSEYTPVPDSDCWYVHDLCVSKDFRSKGIATQLANSILINKKIVALTAVQNSEHFWNKFGFRTFFESEYCGLKASYMILIKAV